jgi:hypothetical protein
MSYAQRVHAGAENSRNGRAAIRLALEVRDRTVLDYLEKFDEEDRPERALDALRVGVIALRSVSPTLDADAFARQLEQQIGPGSNFARTLDPNNREGVIALIEERVKDQVEKKIKTLLDEFSLDRKESALSRIGNLISGCFKELRHDLDVEEGRAAQAERSPAKGLDFQDALYHRLVQWAHQLGDEVEFVANTPGAEGRKTGDYVVALGDATGAPGLKIAIEAKNQRYTLRQASNELQRAKNNREAACGIFAFAKGCEPSEVGDFHRVGEDFYCTIDRDLLDAGDLLYFEGAYKIARVQAVAAVRKEATGRLDLQGIRDHIDYLTGSVKEMGDLVSKACAVKRSGEAIEKALKHFKDDLKERLQKMLDLLQVQPTA